MDNRGSDKPLKSLKRKRLSAKTQRAIAEYVKDPDATLQTLADRSGFSSPGSVHRALKTHQEIVRERMEARPKLKFDALLDRLEDGLNATAKKYAQDKGVFTDEKEDPDYSTRKEYLFLAHKLRGDLDRSDDDAKNSPQVIANAGAIVNLIVAERQARGLDNAITPAQGDTAR